jgi:hypothetical protein
MPPSTSISPSTSTIPVPNSLSPSSNATLPHATHRALLLHLQSDPSTISQLQDTLTTSLASAGWTDRVRALALELLRSGTCTTFPELLTEVLRRAKIPPPAANGQPPTSTEATGKKDAKETANSTSTKKGLALANGHAPTTVILPQGSYGTDGWPDVRIPLKTVEEGVEFLKAKVRDVVEVVEPEDVEERGSSDED